MNRTNYKDYKHKVYVNEDLTRTDGLILKKALRQKKSGSYTQVWTAHGKVFARCERGGTPLCLSDKKEYLPEEI